MTHKLKCSPEFQNVPQKVVTVVASFRDSAQGTHLVNATNHKNIKMLNCKFALKHEQSAIYDKGEHQPCI